MGFPSDRVVRATGAMLHEKKTKTFYSKMRIYRMRKRGGSLRTSLQTPEQVSVAQPTALEEDLQISTYLLPKEKERELL